MATRWSPKKLGYLTVVLAKNMLEGHMPFDGQEIDNVGNIRVAGDVVIMGNLLISLRKMLTNILAANLNNALAAHLLSIVIKF